MTAPPEPSKFRLVEIGPFDARRGYKRCSLPGVCVSIPPPSYSPFGPIEVAADFWRNRTGGLLVRFSNNQPYVFHFEAFLANGDPVPEEAIGDFGNYIADVLLDWEGADDAPDPDFISPI